MRLAALIVLVLLSACAHTPTIPKVVEVPVRVVVEVPEALTRDCDPVPKQRDTFGEAIRLANARAESLAECTARMRQIRALKR
jgi:hypothetical protein